MASATADMAASSSASVTANTDPAFLDSFNRWRRALSQFTGLGQVESQTADSTATTSTQAYSLERLKKDCQRCEKLRDEVIAESPIVRFMLQHVDSLPTPPYVTPSIHPDVPSSPANSSVPIFCSPCGPDRGGGFSPNLGVILCQDRIFSKNHVEDTLAHELLHEWDHRRFKVDWNDVRMVACSEIRAASLSGDCRWGRELRRRNFAFTKQHQACTRRRAVLSVLQHPTMQVSSPTASNEERLGKQREAERLVNEVWESCWNDTRPFDEIY